MSSCLTSIRRFLTSTATATLVSAFVLSRIDYCSSLLFGSTHDVTSHLQRMQNYAARIILRLPMSSNMTTHLRWLHWLPVSLTCCRKSHHTPATLAPAHASCLFSIDLHTVRQHLVIACFLLLLLLSETLFHMMSGVPITVIIFVSFEHILVLFSLRSLNFFFDYCIYVHGLVLL